MITTLDLIDPTTIRPMPGVAIVELDPLPERIGSLFVPDIARATEVTDTSHTGIVLAVGYGRFGALDAKKRMKAYPGVTEEDFGVGDRVVFRLLMYEMNQKRALVDVNRIDAVIE